MTDEERRHLWGLAWAVREFGEEELDPGVASELAAGVLSLIDDQAAPAAAQADPPEVGEAQASSPREQDHSTEDAVLRAFEDPTPQNQHDAELRVALLQRRYDHVLRRLDGAGEASPYPVHRHDASEHPAECLHAVLHELAGATLPDRAQTLAHGLTAVRTLQGQVAEARSWARGFDKGYFSDVDTDAPPEWLTAPLSAEGDAGEFRSD